MQSESLLSFICGNLTRYLKGTFKEDIGSTIALEFATKEFTVSDGSKVKVIINDTGFLLKSWAGEVQLSYV